MYARSNFLIYVIVVTYLEGVLQQVICEIVFTSNEWYIQKRSCVLVREDMQTKTFCCF